jgi:hypothetical protein
MALAIPFVSILSAVPLGIDLAYLYAQSKQGANGTTPMADSGVRAELIQALKAEYAAFAAADRAKIAKSLQDEMTEWKNKLPKEEAPSLGSRALQATGALIAAPIALPIAGVSLLYNATKAELKRRSDAAADAKVKADAAKAAEKVAFEAAAPARAAAAVAQAKATEAAAVAAAARSEAERAASAEATAKLKLATAKLEEYTAASTAATAESNRMAAEAEAAQADVQRTAAAAAAAAAAEEVAAQKAREAADAETARAKQAEETQAAEEAKAAAAAAAAVEARAAADRAAAEAEAKAVPFAENPLMKPTTFRRPSVGFESAPLLPLPPDLPPPTFTPAGPPMGPAPLSTVPLPTFDSPPGGSTNVTPIAAAPPELQTTSPAAIAFAERNAAAVESGGPSAFGQAYPTAVRNEAELLKEVVEDQSLAAQAPSQASSEATPDAKAQETCEPTAYLEKRKALIDALENRAKFKKIPKLWSRFVDTCLQGDAPPMPLSKEWRAAGQDVDKQKAALVNLVATLKKMNVLDDTLEDKIVSNWMMELGGKRRRTPKGGKRRRVRNSTFRRHRKH